METTKIKMWSSDKLKRDIARIAFEGFLEGKPLLDSSLTYNRLHDFRESGIKLELRVNDPGKGPRYFSVKVTEHFNG